MTPVIIIFSGFFGDSSSSLTAASFFFTLCVLSIYYANHPRPTSFSRNFLKVCSSSFHVRDLYGMNTSDSRPFLSGRPHLLGPLKICLILDIEHDFVDWPCEGGIHPLVPILINLVVFFLHLPFHLIELPFISFFLLGGPRQVHLVILDPSVLIYS